MTRPNRRSAPEMIDDSCVGVAELCSMDGWMLGRYVDVERWVCSRRSRPEIEYAS